jgi:glucose-6-phosphate isomerase
LAESLGKKYARKVACHDGAENWEQDKSKVINTGRTPISARGTGDLHSIQQNNIEGENNKIVTFIKVGRFENEIIVAGTGDYLEGKLYSDLIATAEEATEWALARAGRPSCTITIPEISPFFWGGLIFFFEMATAYEGELLGVNAFDQPGVEGYKNYMYCKLGKGGIAKEISDDIMRNQLKKDKRYII